MTALSLDRAPPVPTRRIERGLSGYKHAAYASSPPADALPPPIFEDVDRPVRAVETVPPTPVSYRFLGICSSDGTSSATSSGCNAARHKHNVVRAEHPSLSKWCFDYLFTMITFSTEPELFGAQYPEEFEDVLYKISSVIESTGRMPNGLPPPSFFQAFYYLRRMFPNGLITVNEFVGDVGATLLLRLLVLGIVVADQAIFDQRDLNKDWQEICGMPNSFVDTLEKTALVALNGDVFDLSEDRLAYLDWLDHLGYHAQFHHSRRGHRATYLRHASEIIASERAHVSFLPLEYRRSYGYPIQLSALECLTLLLCWGLDVTPLRQSSLIQTHIAAYAATVPFTHTGVKLPLRPTAADVLADLAEECRVRLLHPLSPRVTCFDCSRF
ncbi:hypothetical protein C8J57DRAFT_1292811 [Mycena rebaudengoi]|nr:hypothetical protein C8J57DRAFT_1292811 [Mycena rebaudengoi]